MYFVLFICPNAGCFDDSCCTFASKGPLTISMSSEMGCLVANAGGGGSRASSRRERQPLVGGAYLKFSENPYEIKEIFGASSLVPPLQCYCSYLTSQVKLYIFIAVNGTHFYDIKVIAKCERPLRSGADSDWRYFVL